MFVVLFVAVSAKNSYMVTWLFGYCHSCSHLCVVYIYPFYAAEAEREARDLQVEREYDRSILNHIINWSGYEENNFINKKELGLLLDYDHQPTADQIDLLNEKGNEYAALFVKAVDTIKTKETVEYLIVLVDQLLTHDATRATCFHSLSQQDPAAPFLK